MAPFKLDLSPEPLEGESDITTFVQDAFDRVEPNVPLFHVLAGTAEPVQAFVAHSPDVALKWICRRVSKRRLMRFINNVYDNPHIDLPDSVHDGSQDELVESDRPAKRTRVRKEPTTRQVNQRLKEQLDFALLETVANTQDLTAAKKVEITYSASEQRYRNFAKQFHGVGVSEVAEMINRAKAVATFECLHDWRVVLETWRELHRDGRRLFANATTRLPALEGRDGICSSTVAENDFDDRDKYTALSQATERSERPVALTRVEVEGFRNLLATVRRSETADILGDMRHRWIMAALYAEYERLEGLLRKRVKLTSSRGRGIATMAREQLFGEVYRQDDDTLMIGDDNTARYRAWNRYLEYGKRWMMLREKFGVGIFALLPRGGVPNSFVERRPIQRLEDWMNMLTKCNDNVREMSEAIEPLLVSCMREEQPPEQLLFEAVDAVEFQEWDREDLFLPAADTQRGFVEVGTDHVEIADSQPQHV